MKLSTIVAAGCVVLCPALARANDAASALLHKCAAAESRVTSIQAVCKNVMSRDGETSTAIVRVLLRRPNFARITLTEGAAAGGDVYSNGKTLYMYVPGSKQYMGVPADASGGNVGSFVAGRGGMVLSPFFDPMFADRLGAGGKVSMAGVKTVGGVACHMIKVAAEGLGTVNLAIGPDGLLRSFELRTSQAGHSMTMSCTATSLHANVATTKSQFAWTPPKDAKEGIQTAGAMGGGGSDAAPGDSVLKDGTIAPDFSLSELHGDTVQFSSVCKANKVTILNFWATWCGPCCEELPHLSELYDQMKAKGVEVLAVNLDAEGPKIDQMWKEKNLHLRVLLHGQPISDQYKVTGIPTNYIVGPDGKILASIVGYDPDGIKAAVEKALK